jgi:hypothetical protein
MSDQFKESQWALNEPLCVIEIIEGEAIIINSVKGSYYSLAKQATLIIQSLLDGFTLKEIFQFNQVDKNIENKITALIEQVLSEDIFIANNIHKNKTQPNKLNIIDEAEDLNMETYTDMKEMLELDPIHDADETVGWPKKK